MIYDLDKQVLNNMYATLADTVISHIDNLEKSKNKITRKDMDSILEVIDKRIQNNTIYFDNDSCLKINEMFNRVFNLKKDLSEAQTNKLIRMFHYIDYQSKNSQVTDKLVMFNPKLLINTINNRPLKDKVSENDRFTRLFLYDKNKLSYAMYNLSLSDGLFEDLSNTNKLKMLNNIVCSQASNIFENWIINNFNYLAKVAIEYKDPELSYNLLYQNISNMLGSTQERWGCFNNTMSTSGIKALNELREYVFGSISEYQKIKDIAASLGCEKDDTYWRSIIFKQTEDMQFLPDGLEF